MKAKNPATNALGRLKLLNHLLLIFIISLAFSTDITAQKGKGKAYGKNNTKNITIRSCTEYIGNGKIRVNFSYENPNKKDIILDKKNSKIVLKPGNLKVNGVNKFKKGIHENAISYEIESNEKVEWTIINPSGKSKTVVASINSSHCSDASTIIIPVFGQSDGKIEDSILDLALQSLASSQTQNPIDLVYQINNQGEVLIEIVAKPGVTDQVLSILSSVFNRTFDQNSQTSDFVLDPQQILNSESSVIDVFFPISQLTELNNYSSILNFVRTVYSPFLNAGLITSQGDLAQRSDQARNAFKYLSNGEIIPVDGSGVKIGVISNSFGTEPFTSKPKPTVDVENGDLPGTGNPNGYETPVEVLKEFQYGVASDEGRAMMQIIHDVAPGAELAFHSGSTTLREFETSITALANAGCDVIVDDVTFVTEPFFKDGVASQLIDNFIAQDKLYYTSAGNFSDKAYQNVFNPSTEPVNSSLFPSGSPVEAHVYGANDDGSEDIFQSIAVLPGIYMIVLQWNEPHASQNDPIGATTDLDLYLVSDQGNLIVGNNRINIEGDPTEILIFEAVGEGLANLMIVNEEGNTPPGLEFRYVAFQSNGLEILEYFSGAPSVTGHAMTQSAITVGAAFHQFAGNPVAESFSSLAGSISDGRNLEIDITAPDGANVNVQNFSEDTDGDGFSNFFGTSAAAPHAAGAMALMLSAIKDWYPAGLSTELAPGLNNAEQLLGLFSKTALNAGPEEKAGPGLLQADLAFDQIANRTPTINQLIIEEGKLPSAESFVVTISGENFTEGSIVVFDSTEIPILSFSENSIEAIIEPFEGNPSLMVSAPSKTPSGNDGGDSNRMYFFGDNKIALSIIPDSLTIEFGQEILFSYQVLGLPTGVTLESLGLPPVMINSPAVLPYPDVNNYITNGEFETPLSPDQLDLYQVNFRNSLLKVSKKELTVAANNLQATYGDAIEVSLDYLYDTTGISNNEEFLELITNSHNASYFPENRLAVMNKFKALVNEGKVDLLDGSSWMITEAAINKFKALVNNFNVVELEAALLNDYQDDPDSGIPNKFKALVNGQSLIEGNAEIFDAFENKFKALVNDTDLGGPTDNNDYSNAIAIVDEDDENVPQLYSINLISGLDVTTVDNDPHYIIPGSFNNALASNFIIEYIPGRLSVDPKELSVLLTEQEVTINYGDTIPQLTSTQSELAYDDILTVTYNFNPEFTTAIPAVGNYDISQSVTVTSPSGDDKSGNYQIMTDTGILNVNKTPNLTSALMPWGVERAFLLYDSENHTDEGAKAQTYILEETGCFSEFNDGTVLMTGNIVHKNNPDSKFSFEIWLSNRMAWDDWFSTGRSYVTQGSGIDVGDLYQDWEFFIIDPEKTSRLIGSGENDGDNYLITHKPYDFSKGVQYGIGANAFNYELGLLGWFAYTDENGGNPRQGDFILEVISNQNNQSENTRTSNYAEGKEEITEELKMLDQENLVAYPNPATDHFILRKNNLNLSKNDINFFDSQGRLLSIPMINSEAENTITMDLSSLQGGFYIIRIDLGDKMEVIRLIKK